MKRFLSNVVCILTICAMVSFVGCGDKDAKKKEGDKAGETKDAGDDKGSDKK